MEIQMEELKMGFSTIFKSGLYFHRLLMALQS